MTPTAKNVLIGIAIGLCSFISALLLWCYFGSNLTIEATIKNAYYEGFLGKIIGLSALANVIPFYIFLQIPEEEKARGVLIATFIPALAILYLQLF